MVTKTKENAEPVSLLSAKRISFRFGDREVFREVDLELRKGELVYLTGENGAGKTTLSRVLVGLESPHSGAVDCDRGCIRMMVPQDFVIWPHLSVSANLKLGRGTRRSRVPIDKIVSSFELPDLLRTRAGRLSFGQQHRVALARAFAQQPDFLVLDEPLSNADVDAKARLIEVIKEMADSRDIGVLWITHSEDEIDGGARRLRLDDRILREA